MLTSTIGSITVTIKMSSTAGSNGAVIKVKDSDGAVLFISGSLTPTTRTETVINAVDLSAQPTDRFTVAVEVSLDNNDEGRVGGILVKFN